MHSLRVTKVAVIGCGFVAETAHLPAYLHAPRVRLVAVADTSEQRLRHISKKFGVKRLYTDYYDLLEKESDIDGVSICLPTHLHKDAVIASAAARKHVLCEKPLALTVNDAQEMVEVAKKYRIRLYVGFCLRFAKVFAMIKKHVANGLLTEPLKVKAVAKLMKKPEKGSWYFDRTKGGGALFDTGSHLADLLQWIFGDATVIASQFEAFSDMPNIDAKANVEIAFRNGVEGVLEVSWKNPSQHYYIQVQGSDGTLLANLDESTLRLRKDTRILGSFTNGFDLIVDQRLPHYWEEIWRFVETLGNGAIHTSLATGRDGLRSLELISSAYYHWSK